MSAEKVKRHIAVELSEHIHRGDVFILSSARDARVELLLTYRRSDGEEQHQFVLNGEKSNKYVKWGRMMNKLEGFLFEIAIKKELNCSKCQNGDGGYTCPGCIDNLMKKTPRTEKAATEYARRDWGKFGSERTYPPAVTAAFARVLETENQALRKQINQDYANETRRKTQRSGAKASDHTQEGNLHEACPRRD